MPYRSRQPRRHRAQRHKQDVAAGAVLRLQPGATAFHVSGPRKIGTQRGHALGSAASRALVSWDVKHLSFPSRLVIYETGSGYRFCSFPEYV